MTPSRLPRFSLSLSSLSSEKKARLLFKLVLDDLCGRMDAAHAQWCGANIGKFVRSQSRDDDDIALLDEKNFCIGMPMQRRTLTARATDGTGTVQPSQKQGTVPNGATGYHYVTVQV